MGARRHPRASRGGPALKPVATVLAILCLVCGGGLLSGGIGAQEPPPQKTDLRGTPPIETKVRQVPGAGSLSVPLWKQHWELARKAVLEKEISRAIRAYRQALALKPNLDEARLELVRVLESGQRYEEAAAELEVFVEHQPHNLKVQQELGDLLALRKEYRRAADSVPADPPAEPREPGRPPVPGRRLQPDQRNRKGHD